MTNIWKWVLILCGAMLVLAVVLIGVAYITGGSFDRLISTTDIADMTKFVSREQLEVYVTQFVNVINGIFG